MALVLPLSKISRKNMRVYISVLAILLGGCATTELPIANEEVVSSEPVELIEKQPKEIKRIDIESIISNKALSSYKGQYSKATSHKAFAQSKSGAWNWKSNRTSKEHAINSALISCQANNTKYEERHPCRVINIDGEWVNKK